VLVQISFATPPSRLTADSVRVPGPRSYVHPGGGTATNGVRALKVNRFGAFKLASSSAEVDTGSGA